MKNVVRERNKNEIDSYASDYSQIIQIGFGFTFIVHTTFFFNREYHKI